MSRIEVVVYPPPVETLLNAGKGYYDDAPWPEEVLGNEGLKNQAKMRLELYNALCVVFEQIRNVTMTITEAIDAQILNSKDATVLYRLLADFLEADPYNRRIILYFPFELLCDKSWKSCSARLNKAIVRFNQMYMQRWYELLNDMDVRANFVDGDILEPEISDGPTPRVAKAAHLIPKLVEKRLISITEVIGIMKGCESRILKDSIHDALLVLTDMQMIHADEVAILRYKRSAHKETEGLKNRAYTKEQLERMPQARTDWEKREWENINIRERSNTLAGLLLDDSRPLIEIEEFKASESYMSSVAILIRGVGIATEILAENDPQRSQALYSEYEPILYEFWHRGVPEIRDCLVSVWSRLISLGVLNSAYLEQFDVTLPKPDSLHVRDNRAFIEKGIIDTALSVQHIESDPELSRFLHPAVLLYGSRIKGYAAQSADFDIAVFVRPDVDIEERPRLRKFLSRAFSDKRTGGKIVEFWLANKDDALYVRDIPTTEVTLADSTWAHVLFGGVWCGVESAIKELYKNLLSEYLFLREDATSILDFENPWLEEMERDVLQYRFMHKGYQNYYPEQGGINTQHSYTIDSRSSFWDSGYRRMATKLFVSRVFLPKLNK